LDDPKKTCVCSLAQINNYKKRLSGPLADRIDLFCNVYPVPIDVIGASVLDSTSSKIASYDMDQIRETILRVRETQKTRFLGKHIDANAYMTTEHIKKHCYLNSKSKLLLNEASAKLNLSVRSYYKVLKVARTIADINFSESILEEHLMQALFYRGS
jgi:magnesium chelatase family protein